MAQRRNGLPIDQGGWAMQMMNPHPDSPLVVAPGALPELANYSAFRCGVDVTYNMGGANDVLLAGQELACAGNADFVFVGSYTLTVM